MKNDQTNTQFFCLVGLLHGGAQFFCLVGLLHGGATTRGTPGNLTILMSKHLCQQQP